MLQGWRLTISKLYCIPQRYVLGIMGFLAVVNAYMMRVVLSIAITEMVSTESSAAYDPEACPFEFENGTGSITNPSHIYPWTSQQEGLILSSFYWGYVLTHIPGGIIAEKFGGKHALSLGILCTAVFTFVTPFMIYATDGNWVWMVVFRVIVGFGEGTTFPALTTLLSSWVPLSERSKIGTLVYAGSQIGTIVANSAGGALIAASNHWAIVFYVFGGIGMLWYVLFSLLCYSDPESHPFISDKERLYLEEEIKNIDYKKRVIPWRSIFTSWPVWALVICQIGHDWGFFAMVTDLPKYMKDVLHFNVKDNGLLSSLPYVLMWIVSMSSGWLCDWLVSKKLIGITMARKVFTTNASMGPAIFILAASYSGCNRPLAVGMFTIAMGFMGTFYCGMKVNALDLAPNYAGAIMAVVNGIGALSGIIVPYVIGAITENHTLAEWRIVFWITFAVFAVTNLVYAIFGSGEVQTWNEKDEEELESKISQLEPYKESIKANNF